MRKIVLIIIMILLLLFSLVYGEKAGVLAGILKPESITLSKERLYVVEGATFYVYSLKDLHLIAKFGKKGEGPGELKVTPMFSNRITGFPGNLFVEGRSKVIYFSLEGKLLKEVRKKEGYRIFNVIPIENNYAAIRMLPPTEEDKKFYLGLSLVDAETNLVKELYKQEFPEKEKDMVMVTDSICFAVYRDRIYVEESARGFLIAVFDGSGKKLYEIKKDIEARKITEEDKKAIFKNFKEDSFVNLLAKSQGGWENFKKTREFIYPHTFPAIKDLIVTGGRIYVSTYETRDNKEKYIIMDLKGKILSTPYMPVPQESSFVSKTLGRGNRFYGIVDNTYYYLQENEENEEWELHVTDIK